MKTLQQGPQDSSENRVIKETIRVHCRLRPHIPEDNQSSEVVAESELLSDDRSAGQTVPGNNLQAFNSVHNVDRKARRFTYRKTPTEATSKEFRFHGIFDQASSQQEVYDTAAKDIVDGVLAGYNGTICAYGQTGSGKTYTMRGQHEGDWCDDEGCGITVRALRDIFEWVRCTGATPGGADEEVSVSISYLQIYCEIVQDLLDPTNGDNLSIREKDGRVYVEGLSRVHVTSLAQCRKLLAEGDANRTTACTRLNAHSSRSHAALLVHLTRRERSSNLADGHTVIESTLYLVDLAGSERAKRSGATLQRFEELKAINLSLSALGNCICALSQGRPHIPYRDSKLTRLLQQSLGGNSRTSLVVNIPPGTDLLGETHCSLLFAQRAMTVAVVAKVNRQVDYAQLYSQVQSKLDNKDESISRLQIEKARLMADQSALQAKVEELGQQRQEHESKLQAAEAGFKESLKALSKASSDPGGERAVAAVESVSQKWRAEVSQLEAAHARDLKELKAKYEKRLAACKQSMDEASEGWQAVELELTKEREGHLATITDYRRCHERLLHTESETSVRLAELLAEVNEKTNQVEELQAAMEAVKANANQREDMMHQMQDKLHTSDPGEAWRHALTVPCNQLDTMEQLFAETVEKLEDRLKYLESSASTSTSTTSTLPSAFQAHTAPASSIGTYGVRGSMRAGASHAVNDGMRPRQSSSYGKPAQKALNNSVNSSSDSRPIPWAVRRQPLPPTNQTTRPRIEPGGRVRANTYTYGSAYSGAGKGRLRQYL